MARFLLDENVPHIFVDALRNAGHEATAIQQVGLSAAPDQAIFEYAQTVKATIISLDLDFSDLRLFPVGNHYGVVVLRLKDLRPSEMATRVVEALANEVSGELFGSLVVIDRHRSRQLTA